MEEWLPLLVAIVGAFSAIGVAFWNSRGESAELRQLKAMNDVLEGLPTGAPETVESARVRNELVARIARAVQGAPRRRLVGWTIVAGIAAAGVVVAAAVLLAPVLGPILSTDWLALLVSIATAAFALLTVRVRARADRANDEE